MCIRDSTLADLAETTSVKAFIKIREQHPDKTIPVCYYLYSLEGALSVSYTHLDVYKRQE